MAHSSISSTHPLTSAAAPLFTDRLDPKVSSWITPWDGTEQPDVLLVGAPLSKTSISHSGASFMPGELRALFGTVTPYNIDHDVDLSQRLSVRDAGNAIVHPTDLARSRAGIHDAVRTVLTAAPSAMPIILGGDHSITAPSVEAFAAHVGGPVGIVQLDAHMDLRNLDDGGRTNGTPIRQLIEGGTIRGEHVVQIGLHAFANARAYAEFARQPGVTLFTARQVAHEGIDALVARALEIASAGTRAVYVTVDMDVLDQAYAPGVPAQVPGGMTSWQLFDAVLALGQHPSVKAFDIVEVDPSRDLRRATVRTALHTMLTFLTGYALRSR
jgi:formiminoglutamase